MLHSSRLWDCPVPLLKYFFTVGFFLFGGLFALSNALGPARDAPPFVRHAASLPPKQQVPRKQTSSNAVIPAQKESKGNSASDGVELPDPIATPRDQSPTLEAALVENPADLPLVEPAPFPSSRPESADNLTNQRAGRVDLQAQGPAPKKARKVMRRRNVWPHDVQRAYWAL